MGIGALVLVSVASSDNRRDRSSGDVERPQAAQTAAPPAPAAIKYDSEETRKAFEEQQGERERVAALGWCGRAFPERKALPAWADLDSDHKVLTISDRGEPLAINVSRIAKTKFGINRVAIAKGEKNYGLVVSKDTSWWFVLIDPRAGKVKRKTELPRHEVRYGRPDPMVAYGEGRYAVMSESEGEVIVRVFGEDGKPRGKTLAVNASTYVRGQVVHADDRFGILVGPKGQYNAFSVGILEIGLEGQKLGITWLVSGSGQDSWKSRRYVIKEQMVYAGGYRVRAKTYKGSHHEPDEYWAVLHLENGVATVERCE